MLGTMMGVMLLFCFLALPVAALAWISGGWESTLRALAILYALCLLVVVGLGLFTRKTRDGESPQSPT